ncbi:MAG TPA: hypothetical protein VHX68_10225, partial [Planctomycetaceae bacterium]|nr:hypothetical protein [Planctomycetaceae bacterium]
SSAIIASNGESFTISFTAPVKDRSEVSRHETLRTCGFLSTRSSLKRGAHFSVVASIFMWRSGPFFTPQKNQKNRAGWRFAGDFRG